jgi:hypothetical protein
MAFGMDGPFSDSAPVRAGAAQTALTILPGIFRI